MIITPASPVPDAAVGIPYEIQFTATGTAPWLWSATGPAWFSIDPSTGLGSGTPTGIGAAPIVIYVTDFWGTPGTLTI